MANPYKYAYPGPPFNWLGHFSKTQWDTFNAWYTAHAAGNWSSVQLHYRIRAQQLRKTAGALEQYYFTVNNDKLSPTFAKASWQPAQGGYFPYVRRDDHLPMVAMSSIKTYLKDQLQQQDDSVFQMNNLRNIIEKTEDKAQSAFDAPNAVTDLISQINGYFAIAQYAPVLVNDQNDVYPSGSTSPRYRVAELDDPTTWEMEQHARVAPGGAVAFKEEAQPANQ